MISCKGIFWLVKQFWYYAPVNRQYKYIEKNMNLADNITVRYTLNLSAGNRTMQIELV